MGVKFCNHAGILMELNSEVPFLLCRLGRSHEILTKNVAAECFVSAAAAGIGAGIVPGYQK